MFERLDGPVEGLTTSDLVVFRDALARLCRDVDDAERVDRIGLLEAIKAAAAAAQALATMDFDSSQRERQRAAGVREERVGRGITAQVALARRESPARAARFVGWARVLVKELPATFAALQRGETTEWRAMLVARETIWLSREQRAVVDAALAGRLGSLGDREVEAECKRLAYQLDPDGFVARSRNAERDRRVTLRPAPDTMARLTALLPVAQGVAAYAALARAADTARAAGDPRGRGQVMADTLVQRVTGQTTADGVPVEINLVMTDRTLLHDGTRTTDTQDAANLVGYGPIPAGLARDLATGAARVWVRRLYTDPGTGQLVAMDKRRRRFNGKLRHAIIIRDQFCRTPWCGAPIRQVDHTRAAADGGQTSYRNGQGLCEACNYAKAAYGWTTEPGPRGTRESVIITTPTGHTYTSRPPDLPGTPPPEPTQRAGPDRHPSVRDDAA